MKYIKHINEYLNLPQDLNKNQIFRHGNSIDVALMTFDEYYKIVNPSGKYHEEHWNYSVDDLNKNLSDNPKKKLLKRKKYGNMEITFYENKTLLQYGYRDENDVYHTYTDEEVKNKGLKLYDTSISVFHGEKCIGWIGDEWGATLVYLAREYSGSGIGKDLTFMFRKIEPDRDSGGFTEKGYKNIKNVYREFVKEYLRNGIYSHLVKNGEITTNKVKEILKSADLENYRQKTSDYANNYSENMDENTLIYRFNDNMDFIIFDKRLINYYLEKGYSDSQIKHFLKAHVYLPYNTVFGTYELYNSYGINKKMEKLLLTIALQTLKKEDCGMCLLRVQDSFSEQTKNILTTLKNNNDFEFNYDKEFPMVGAKQGFDYSPLFNKSLRFFKSMNRIDREEFQDYLTELAYYTSDI